jgi:DNA-binding transcriptional ArsR family regulator
MLRSAHEPFAALAEPTRRRMLDLLRQHPRMVGELAELLGISQPNASKHLRVLREAGLVRVRRDSQRRWYTLHPAPLAELDSWLEPYRRLWAGRIDALQEHLDAMPDHPDAGRERRPTTSVPAPDRVFPAVATIEQAGTSPGADNCLP